MLKAPVALLTSLVLLAVTSGISAAQDPDEIAVELRDNGVYVEPGAEGDESELAGIVSGTSVSIVSLANDILPSAESFSRDLRDDVGGTVLVVTPSEIAAASTTFPNDDVDRALDAFGGSVEDGTRSFISALDATTTAGADSSSGEGSTDGSSGGGSAAGLLIVLGVIVVAIVAVVLFVRSRNRKRVKDEIETRRATVGEELEQIGGEIVELSDRVTVTDNDEATTHFRVANEEFLGLQDRLAAAKTLWEVTQVDYDADQTAWHLDAAEALVEGNAVPEQPPDPRLQRPEPPPEPERRHERDPEPERSRSRGRRADRRAERRRGWDEPRTTGGSRGGGPRRSSGQRACWLSPERWGRRLVSPQGLARFWPDSEPAEPAERRRTAGEQWIAVQRRQRLTVAMKCVRWRPAR